jgi:tRNA(Ile2) C34 agmatinyltransferase TiaS
MEIRDNERRSQQEPVRSFIALTVDDFPKEVKPVCSECGGRTRSHGETWQCLECGKRWVKIRRQCKDCPYKVSA